MPLMGLLVIFGVNQCTDLLKGCQDLDIAMFVSLQNDAKPWCVVTTQLCSMICTIELSGISTLASQHCLVVLEIYDQQSLRPWCRMRHP